MKNKYLKRLLNAIILGVFTYPGMMLQAQEPELASWEQKAKERFKPLTLADKNVISQAQPEISRLGEDKFEAKRILVFYRCEAFIHTAIPWANFALQEMARKTQAFSVDLSDQYSVFDEKNLEKYDAIVFNSSSSPNVNTHQREAILNFVKSGKGIIGIHMATDFDGWDEGTSMIGGRWNGHPWTKDYTWAFKLNDPYHILNAAFDGKGFWYQDEIYQYKPESFQGADNLRVLVSLDMSKDKVLEAMEVDRYIKYQETYGEGPREVPVSWIREYGNGRVFYTNFGHREETYTHPEIMKHLYDGILYALGYMDADATPTANLNDMEAALAPVEKPLANLPNASRNYQETNGVVSVEAENYASQVLDTVRRWYVINEEDAGPNIADRDRNHAATASGKSYLEILPDTRVTHSDSLITGVNFSNEPGKMAILSYNIYFSTPGEYMVWVRAFSTGGEDNGIHVGIDGTWPESGQRIQFCPGKYQWTWSSAQRVPENHCGEARTIRIMVPHAGLHTIHFSMREDGFEFDKFIMTLDHAYQPEGGEIAATYVPSESYAELNDRSLNTFDPIFLKATTDFEFMVEGFVPYYIDEARNALAINAAEERYRGKFAAAQHRFKGETGIYALTLFTMQETDGESEYLVRINGNEILKTKNCLTKIDYSIHEGHAVADVQLKPGDLIQVTSNASTNGLIPEGNTTAYARGRWTELMLIRNGKTDIPNDP